MLHDAANVPGKFLSSSQCILFYDRFAFPESIYRYYSDVLFCFVESRFYKCKSSLIMHINHIGV